MRIDTYIYIYIYIYQHTRHPAVCRRLNVTCNNAHTNVSSPDSTQFFFLVVISDVASFLESSLKVVQERTYSEVCINGDSEEGSPVSACVCNHDAHTQERAHTHTHTSTRVHTHTHLRALIHRVITPHTYTHTRTRRACARARARAHTHTRI